MHKSVHYIWINTSYLPCVDVSCSFRMSNKNLMVMNQSDNPGPVPYQMWKSRNGKKFKIINIPPRALKQIKTLMIISMTRNRIENSSKISRIKRSHYLFLSNHTKPNQSNKS